MMQTFPLQQTAVQPGFIGNEAFQYFAAETFPTIQPIHWLYSHFAVGGWSPLQRLSGMLTAHMTQIAPHNGFTWHPHRALEIYTWVIEGELYHEDTTGGQGIIRAGELQRMFAGDYIEHQELNLSGQKARVIQIWYVADRQHRGLDPHYQQVGRADLPYHDNLDGRVYHLIGADSPMVQHMTGRLTATTVKAGGMTQIEAPQSGEDAFIYVTDGTGRVAYDKLSNTLGQYDVMLATPDMSEALVKADGDDDLHFMTFYLPSFIR